MKTSSLLLLPLLFLFLAPASSQGQEKWLKGNLHSQSYWSDGDEVPELVMKWYKDNGYHFVALTDHNIIAEGEKWKTIPKKPLLQEGFQKYLELYGEDWVEYKKDSVGTHVKLKTLEEFRPLLEEEGEFLILKAEEVTTYHEGEAVHMNAINLEEFVEPRKGNSVVELMQNNLDAIHEQRDRTGKPIFQILNHPNFTYAISAEDIIKMEGQRFFEVYNGHPYVYNNGDSIHDSTDEIWDKVNIQYAKQGKPLLYGVGTDDGHHYHKDGPNYSNPGRGWVMVKTDQLEPRALAEAMEAGDFYATSGVELESMDFTDNVLKVEIKAEASVNYQTQFIGAGPDASEGEVVKTVEGTTAEFEMPKDFLFLRAKIISDKLKENPHQEGDLETAWTQPYLPAGSGE